MCSVAPVVFFALREAPRLPPKLVFIAASANVLVMFWLIMAPAEIDAGVPADWVEVEEDGSVVEP